MPAPDPRRSSPAPAAKKGAPLAERPDDGAEEPAGFSHLVADFVGVPPAQLRDTSTLSGLLIAAAGAAGFSPIGSPMVRMLPDGAVAGLFLVDGCHMSLHAFPDRGLLLLDVLSLASHDGRKALDVFARRITAREIRSDQRARG
jgi:S-adenosylmethionine/arginine decarboxylase-like enzyme